PYWNDLCAEYHFDVPYQLALGGETRFHSVKNGLAYVAYASDVCVAVHDGVRPFVSESVIDAAFVEAQRSGAAVPVVPVVDSIREVLSDGSNMARNRGDFRLVQTPQVFRSDLLRKAYEQPYCEAFTDDASVVERLGHPVCLTEGNRENIKITTVFDLKWAEAFLSE
ncbi:MAG: 2-C-methyl-D-erythritol 4-phosphate cytidylyltransferase, partial [Paludibacteraceae bacterium]|nr:2-C-methyl-D-erythritol 4-phosphate cytidylyltransferase [Paludibacteraceae bacterium]